MAKPQIQTSFAAGELSPSLWGHVDFAKFAIGASTSRNMWTNYRGGAWSRAGTEFVGFSKQTVNNIASGYIYFPSNPSPGDTITLNGVVFQFVASGATIYQFNIGVNAGGTIALAVLALNTNSTYTSNALLNGATYSDSGGSTTDYLIVTWKSAGPAGNSYRLAASAPATVSGPTLTGGGSTPPRLITFQFNLNQGLVLEFGEQYMRVIDRGAFVVTDSGTIGAITKANPAIVTQNSHGYSTGDWWYPTGCTGMTQVNGRQFVITVINANSFSLQDVYGNNIDSSAYGTYTANSGTGAIIYELATPYAAVDLPFLKFSQSADVMSLCLVNQETGVEYQSYDLQRLANDNWSLVALNTSTGAPSAPANATAVATVPSTTSMGGMTDYQYTVTAIDAGTYRESVASNIADEPDSVDISAYQGSIVVTWDPVANAAYYNIYKALPAVNSTVPSGALFGYCGQAFGLRFVDSNISPDLQQVPPLRRNPFAVGQISGVTITSPGSSLTGPISTSDAGTVIVTTSTGSGMTGYGVIEGGEMLAFVITDGGANYAPADTVVFSDGAGVKATGSIAFAANPSPGDTATLNGRVFTFVASGATSSNYQVNIGGNTGGTIGLWVINLQTSATYLADSLLNVASYTDSGGSTTDNLLVEYNVAGTAGNSYTLAASVATPSGATLTGGSGGVSPTGTLVLGAASGNYPGVVGYVQQRRTYAYSLNNPDTYWMSQPGDYLNFDVRIPTIDSDSITGSPWSVAVDGIQFMIPLLGGMVMLTGQAAYQVMGQGGSPTNPQPITPSSQQALAQAFNGCHFYVPPVQIDYDIYYLQAKGSVIRSLAYNFWINVFTGVDITYLSSHLFSPYSIASMSWCEEPFKLMWAVRSDGVLLCLTAVKPQEVMAWTRHDTQGKFVGSTSVIEPPVDALYLVTQRFFGDDEPFFIERMNDRLWASIEDVWCVDCALSYPHEEPDATVRFSSARGLGRPVDYTDLVGGAGYSQNATASVVDPTGTGCTVTLTVNVTTGVIEDITFSGGSGYTDPVLSIVDPDNQLTSPASATIVLDNSVTVTTDSAVISISSLGSIIRAGGGIVQLTAYLTATTFTGQVISPIVQVVYGQDDDDKPIPFDPGEWTLTAPTSTVSGLWHLVGQTVTGVADGSPITPQVVSAAGTITLDAPASAITVGLAFLPQLQSLYLVDDGNGVQQGRRKNIGAVTVRIEASGSFEVGVNQPDGSAQSPMRVAMRWSNMETAQIDTVGLSQPPYGSADVLDTTYVRPAALLTGDVRVQVAGGFSKPGQVAVQQPLPLPLQVLAFVPEVDTGDDPEMRGNR